MSYDHHVQYVLRLFFPADVYRAFRNEARDREEEKILFHRITIDSESKAGAGRWP